MKKIFLLLLLMLDFKTAAAAQDVTGLWTTIDDETGEPKSVVQLYEYEGKIFGRVVKLFKNHDKTAVGVKGSPKIVGLDILWDLEDQGERFGGGKILDPTKGKIYSSEVWLEDGKLIVRGKIGPFGRNQTWVKYEDEQVSIKNPLPMIPEKE